ncbi:MAG: hypothetical protein AAFY81_06750, partial [Pseudomonadota bacterium]
MYILAIKGWRAQEIALEPARCGSGEEGPDGTVMASLSGDDAPQIDPQEDWPIDPPMVDLPIDTHDRGFYDGFAREVAIPAKMIVSLIIMWAIFFPVSAMETLRVANSTII